ncbi:unnamed protein product, partial [Mesorhabditis belari]|uniref:K Homology domain-containing protein n=1 Tax=Mesorhabditis belari TaxID=2138241 RepID=A0AAF3ECM7_9BILA
MKRHGAEGGDYNRGGSKRQRGDGYADALAAGKFELRFLVSSKSAGAVIGKGGDNIKRLRSQFDATVTVPDSQGSAERVLTIVCVVDNIAPLCAEMLPKFEDAGADGKREAKMLVHMSHAGAIIGKGGSKIKELREETGCNIKVYSECAPQSSDRIVQIMGSESGLPGAVKAVCGLIKSIPIKGATRQYDPINYDPVLANEYGGFTFGGGDRGPPSRGDRGGRDGYGANMERRGGGDGHGRFGGGGPMGGGPRGMGPPMRGGRDMGPPMLGMGGDFGRGPGPQMSGPFGGGGMGAPMGGMGGPMGGYNQGFPGGPPQAGGNALSSTQQVTIPTELGGTIIGRGGERINRIREESGAHIVLEPTAPGQEERIITITGTQNQIHAAQYLLQQCVRQSLSQQGGPGGPGGMQGGMREMRSGPGRFR